MFHLKTKGSVQLIQNRKYLLDTLEENKNSKVLGIIFTSIPCNFIYLFNENVDFFQQMCLIVQILLIKFGEFSL